MMDGETLFWLGLFGVAIAMRVIADRVDPKITFWVAILIMVSPVCILSGRIGGSWTLGIIVITFVGGYVLFWNSFAAFTRKKNEVPPLTGRVIENPISVPAEQAKQINVQLRTAFKFSEDDIASNRQQQMSAGQLRSWAIWGTYKVFQYMIVIAVAGFILWFIDDRMWQCLPEPRFIGIRRTFRFWLPRSASCLQENFTLNVETVFFYLILFGTLFTVLQALYNGASLLLAPVQYSDGALNLRTVTEDNRSNHYMTVGYTSLRVKDMARNVTYLKEAQYRVYHKQNWALSLEILPVTQSSP